MMSTDTESTSQRSSNSSIQGPYRSEVFESGFPVCTPAKPPGDWIDDGVYYAQHLLPCGQGMALWTPTSRRRQAKDRVELGDVGMVDGGGEFIYLFNIFRNKSDPLQGSCLPEDFEPLPLSHRKHCIMPGHWPAGTVLASPSIVVSRKSELPLSLDLNCTGTIGAVLVLPDGAAREQLTVTAELLEYAGRNAIKWFSCMEERMDFTLLALRNHPLRNGSLHIVTSLDRASTYSTMTCTPTSFCDDIRDFTVPYNLKDADWPWTEEARVSVMAAVSKHHVPAAHIQGTVFVRGCRLAISPFLWTRHSLVPASENMAYYPLPPLLPQLKSPSRFLSRRKEDQGNEFGPKGPSVPFHPSFFILQVLLSMHPEVQTLILEDELWLPLSSGVPVTYENMIDLTDKFLQSNGVKKIQDRTYVAVALDPTARKDKVKTGILQATYSHFFPERSARKAREKRLQSIREAIAFLPP